jgi:pimeloyl-ACP methyl ester carboxylesterase
MRNLTFKPTLLLLSSLIAACLYGQETSNADSVIPYGNNPIAGHYAQVNGINMYYEIYGQGEPVVCIHAGGGSVADCKPQIEYFSQHYKVIAADSRGQGKSELNADFLTYRQIADDWAELLNQLRIDSACVEGYSDGGIIGLLLAVHHPAKVKKLAAMGANIQSDTLAYYPWLMEFDEQLIPYVETKIKEKDTTDNWQQYKYLARMWKENPIISVQELLRIKCPVLILGGDRDVVRLEHLVLIYRNIHSAQLCIFPGETHFTTWHNPVLYNSTVDKFFREPFKINDSKLLLEKWYGFDLK